jgi:predicted ATP-dependent endonuclease of OLD family
VTKWFRQILKPLVTTNKNLYPFVSSQLEQNQINKESLVSFLNKADLKITDIIIKEQKHDIDKKLMSLLEKKVNISSIDLSKIKEQGKVESKEIFFHHEVINEKGTQVYELPYSFESLGTQRYYQFSGLLAFMMKNETIFSIDEIAASLNPDLLKHFLLTFLANTKTAQLIATTHSRELLMEKDIIRNDAIWFTEKQENGSTDLYALTDFDSSVIRNTSSIYNAYKIGKLGAKPNLQDHYITTENG